MNISSLSSYPCTACFICFFHHILILITEKQNLLHEEIYSLHMSKSKSEETYLSLNSSRSRQSENSELYLSNVKHPNNAVKCKEYRERSRSKKERELQEFKHQLSKNMKLKTEYEKKARTLQKLKAYYMECLKKNKYKCVECRCERCRNNCISRISSEYPSN